MNNVILRMKDETVEQTNRLQEKFKAPSKSDVIRRAIGLSDMLIQAIENGDRIFIENDDGSKYELTIPGISI